MGPIQVPHAGQTSAQQEKGFRLRNMMFPPCKQSQHINSRNGKSIAFWHAGRKYRHAESCVVVNMVQFCRLHFSYPEMYTPRVGGLMHLDAHIVPLFLSWVGLLISNNHSLNAPIIFFWQILVAANSVQEVVQICICWKKTCSISYRWI